MRRLMTAATAALVTGLALLTRPASAQVEWTLAGGGNGHFYQLIPENITWEEARVAAAAMTFNGFTGHLATLTSAEENAFLNTTFNTTGWIGLFQPDGSNEPDGGFQWVTAEALGFTNWNEEEPNNLGDEKYVEALLGDQWNDATAQVTNFYFVEFGTSGFETSNAPEPTTLGLLTLGGITILARRRK